MDVHVHVAITRGLRQRGVDVLTAQEDGAGEIADPLLLDRATTLGRVLVSQDVDLLIEAQRRQVAGEPFTGLAYGHQRRFTIGQAIEDLELLAAADAKEHAGVVWFLPL